ncbi:MAG: hypothetical protein LM550_15815 [Candidatus Contendobacter sp.]|nr:hypothetical protein [Gammaproteobacteria bacterium]MCC8995118.1 hypothetical protein [Candidatus Contendobacter sp.]
MDRFAEKFARVGKWMKSQGRWGGANLLNIFRHISTAMPTEDIDRGAVNEELRVLETKTAATTKKHNQFLQELGLPPLP